MRGASKLRASIAAALRVARGRVRRGATFGAPRTVLTLDRLSLRGRLVHGWGWALHPTRRIASLRLLRDVVGGKAGLLAEYGFPRPDVAPQHPGTPNGDGTGFVLYGLLRASIVAGEILEFVAEFEDGGREVVSVRANVTFFDGEGEATRAGLARVRRLGREQRAAVRRLLPFGRQDRDRAATLSRALASAASVVVMFDHDLGGGANVFRRQFIRTAVASGACVVLVRWSIARLSYEVDVHLGAELDTLHFFAEGDLQRWLDGLADGPRVVMNNLVSFPAPASLLAWLASFVARKGAHLTVLMHDFQTVCPSWTLLDDRGEFCGVPSPVGRCEACFVANHVPFKSVIDARSIGEWRAAFDGVLRRAAEIRCFSHSSKALLLRAYPTLLESTITVVPHALEHVRNRPVRYDVHAPIRIGVVGEIAPHKGSEIVRALAAVARERGVDVAVVVIGTLGTEPGGGNLTITGRYAPGELPELLERHGVNVCLFPSIWPETFSYVCEELMQMELPVVCFDLGAPAERVGLYARGRVMPRCEAPELLDRITAFVDELRARPAERAS